MKKYISLGVGIALFVSPAFALAQTDTSSQVATLLAELQQLQAQLAQAQGQSSASASSCISLSFNGGIGATGSQVSSLQTFLGISPATGYFGAKTKAALTAWQSAHGISATGYFGNLTRTAMGCIGASSVNSSTVSASNSSGQMQSYTNAQYGFSLQYPSNFSATPASVLNGAKVTLTGPQLSGFSQAPSVLIEASNDPNAVSTCNTASLSGLATVALSPLTALGVNITPTTGTQMIGGVSFRSASVSADLEGTFIQVGFYAALQNGVCYIIGTSVEGSDPSTQGQLQSTSPVVLPASAENIAAQENAILQSLTFSTLTASVSQTTSSSALSQATLALQDAERKSNLNAIQVDLELYYAQNGKYPSTLNAMQNVITSTQDLYDPATFQPYNYQTDAAGDSYTLCATLSTGSSYCVQSLPTTSATNVSTNVSSIPAITFTYPSSANQQYPIGSGIVIQWQTSGSIPSGAFIEFSLLSTNGTSYGIPSNPLTSSQDSFDWVIQGPVCVPDPNYPGTQTCSATLNPGQYQIVAKMYSTVVNGQPSGLVTQASSPWITLTGSPSSNVDSLKG